MKNGLGGAMFWTIDFDDFAHGICGQGRYPLIGEVRDTLKNNYHVSSISTPSPTSAISTSSTNTNTGSHTTDTTPDRTHHPDSTRKDGQLLFHCFFSSKQPLGGDETRFSSKKAGARRFCSSYHFHYWSWIKLRQIEYDLVDWIADEGLSDKPCNKRERLNLGVWEMAFELFGLFLSNFLQQLPLQSREPKWSPAILPTGPNTEQEPENSTWQTLTRSCVPTSFTPLVR